MIQINNVEFKLKMINLKCPEPETTPFFGDSVESSLGAMNEVHTQRGNQLEGNIPPPQQVCLWKFYILHILT